MKQKIILISVGVIVIVLIATGVFWQQKFGKTTNPPKEEVKAYEFAAQIEKIEGSTIETKGIYLIPGKEDWTGPKYEKKITIVVGLNTKFVKITKILPTEEELKKTNGYFESGQLKSREEAGSFIDIQNGAVSGFVAKSDQDIYKLSSFTPTEIKYYVPEYPTN